MVDLPGTTIDLSGTMIDLPVTIVDLSGIMVNLPGTMIDLPSTTIDLPGTMIDFFVTMVDLSDIMVNLPGTSSHLKSFLEPAVPPIRLFLMINMMPLKRCVVKGNYFTALLRHEDRNKFFMSGP